MHVLIVDDEKNCLEDIKLALQPTNFQLVLETCAFKALQLYIMQSFDAVITDYKMADISGLDLMQSILHYNYKAKIILITAFSDFDTAINAVNNNAYAFFSKPVDFQEVIKCLKQIEIESKQEEKPDKTQQKINFKNLQNLTINNKYFQLSSSYKKICEELKKRKP